LIGAAFSGLTAGVTIHTRLDLADGFEEAGVGLGLGGATEKEQGYDREVAGHGWPLPSLAAFLLDSIHLSIELSMLSHIPSNLVNLSTSALRRAFSASKDSFLGAGILEGGFTG
jgi:hypothetical protein